MSCLHIIVNTGAGTGRAARVWQETRRELKKRKMPYRAYPTKREHHAAEYAAQICAAETGMVYLLVVGGDGTINEVLNGITDFARVRLGVVPTGSGNDFARGLGLPQDTAHCIRQICRAVKDCESGKEPRRIDLGEVRWEDGSRIFGISAGIGLDAVVCKRALHSRLKKVLNALHLGKLTYLFLTVQELFTMKTVSVECETERGSCRFPRMIFAAAMNLRAEGGGVPMAPNASPTDGLLSLGSAADIPKWQTFFLLPLLVAAKQHLISGYRIEDAARIRLTAEQPLVLHADGEYCADTACAEFRCLKEKLALLR